MESRRRTFVAAVAAALLALGAGAAAAQPRGDHGPGRHGAQFEWARHDDGPGHRHGGDRHGHRPPQGHGRPQHWHGSGDHWRGHAPHAHGHPSHGHAGGRGAGPRHDLYAGRHLPAHYRTPRYVVHDWHAHRLAPPPRGYRWVQAGGDYLMIAVGTGVIAQVVLGW